METEATEAMDAERMAMLALPRERIAKMYQVFYVFLGESTGRPKGAMSIAEIRECCKKQYPNPHSRWDGPKNLDALIQTVEDLADAGLVRSQIEQSEPGDELGKMVYWATNCMRNAVLLGHVHAAHKARENAYVADS